MDFNIENFKLLGNYVLIDVEQTKTEKVTHSGFNMPDKKPEPITRGEIIQIGLGVESTQLKLGMKIFFSANTTVPVAISGTQQMFKVHVDNIHGYIPSGE